MNTRIKCVLIAVFVVTAAVRVSAQVGQLRSAITAAGAAQLHNGSLVSIGQPFVGMVVTPDNSLALAIGFIPARLEQTTVTNEFSIAPSVAFQNGRFKLGFVMRPGQTWIVEASTNLVDWAPIWADTATDPSVEFEDFTTFLFPYRFYRVRLP